MKNKIKKEPAGQSSRYSLSHIEVSVGRMPCRYKYANATAEEDSERAPAVAVKSFVQGDCKDAHRGQQYQSIFIAEIYKLLAPGPKNLGFFEQIL